jgi:hypothetical protein
VGDNTPCLSRTRRADLCAPGTAAARPPLHHYRPACRRQRQASPRPRGRRRRSGRLTPGRWPRRSSACCSPTPCRWPVAGLGGVSEPTGPILQSHGGCGSTHSQLFRWWAWPLPPRTVRHLEATDQCEPVPRCGDPQVAAGCSWFPPVSRPQTVGLHPGRSTHRRQRPEKQGPGFGPVSGNFARTRQRQEASFQS